MELYKFFCKDVSIKNSLGETEIINLNQEKKKRIIVTDAFVPILRVKFEF